MITRDKDERELEDEGGDSSFGRDREAQVNDLSDDSGSSGVEVQMVLPGGDMAYGKIREEDKVEAIRKGNESSLIMNVENYTEKDEHHGQGVFTENPFEEITPVQGVNKAHVKNEQMDNINFKARKVVEGGQEKELAEGAYRYVSDESGTRGRGKNGGLNGGGVINRSSDPHDGVPEDIIILRDDEVAYSQGRRTNFSGEGLYTYEDKERKNNHMMEKGYNRMIKNNPIDNMIQKNFNNTKYDSSNDCTVIAAPDFTGLDSGAQHSYSHKRSTPLFDDVSVKKEKKKKIINSGKGTITNELEDAQCEVFRGKGGDEAKVVMKNEPRGRDEPNRKDEKVETTTTSELTRGFSRKDNFHLYCKNHNKIFGNAEDGDLSKCENGGMMSSIREAPSGNIGNSDMHRDRIEPLNSSTLVKQENEKKNWKNQLNEISNIIYDKAGEDNHMDEKKKEVRINNGKRKIIYPSIYEDDKEEWFLANDHDEWLVHKLCDWLYNVKDKLYFNIKTQEIYYVKDRSFLKFENSFDESREASLSRMDSQKKNGDENRRESLSQKVHENRFSYELDSDDPLMNKTGERTNADGRNMFENMGDMVSDHRVRAKPCVHIEYSGSRGSNSSRVISRSSSGDGGMEGDSVSYILRSDRTEKRNGVIASDSPFSDKMELDNHSPDSRSPDNRSSYSCSPDSRSPDSRSPDNRSPDNHSSDNHSSDNRSPDNRSPDNQSVGRRRSGRENADVNDETVEEFSMVLEDDLVCGTYSRMGDHNRCENEDFYVTKEILDLNNVSESEGLCFFSGVFDGHGGSNCARYVMNHLKTNLIAKFRQSFLITCKKQCKDKESKLNDLSVEIRALYDSCIKGFDMTDKNYIELSKKYDYKDGSTACVVLIYGPDDDGSLKVLCANCGDSGALICHDRKPVKLSLRHKPDLQEERVRILKCGGIIANINGINRIITKHKVKGQTGREKTFLALSTSRSFGDISYKVPRKIVLCKPFISVYTIDFDMDSFLVLATDGILNVLTDKEIIDIVWRNIHRKPEEAAEEVVHEASRRDSTDDKTCTVIFFYWRKDIFRGESEEASLEAPPREEPPGEDINMFSEVF
ncbi:protein phosphatase 2C, putative [Plasmodium knowlesi strain H]|uniref:Protein phosphatase 2C, putative n=3 Tax=Plasmodium knowlesi TaxID=5850 RepID=A0A5E7X9C0_PLAKH|nr:protein phosphatase PPM4, putative [Plasmodium knowlesi strain H]OTN63815.1 putative Protein phosphatase 2C [Plasmodium knowlesi]CAA9991287.1 protein phosphatase PPM4, putative [Plasmodium knowlesi strain H]SBO26382.1 protein phosphatase 2C, putative [Plasmodium knowlesi strain H]SBO29006.1 protein phosphatase 2C, putative [Plasmodium knowlesi strain H]VVS80761.1 protein phosphatase PPM4, putative [Plasmodium knowlesi strain H]